MLISIKNMVCPRCIKVVHEELATLGVIVIDVSLGEAEIDLKGIAMEDISNVLVSNGFELIGDQESELVEKIKKTIIDLVRTDSRIDAPKNLSTHLSQDFGREYGQISGIFSRRCGLTIERYQILQKIEYAKELLIYGELTAAQISAKLDYSSPAHFANQFKEVTRMTTSEFRKHKKPLRISLDDLC